MSGVRGPTGVLAACVGVLVFGLAPAVQSQPAKGRAPKLVELSREQDFARTRALLGLLGPPPAGAKRGPQAYDEAAANPYPDLPDPLRLNSGERVTTAQAWTGQRRAELLDLFQREVYGRTPAATPEVHWAVRLTSTHEIAGVRVVTRELVGWVDNTAYLALDVHIIAEVTVPAEATGPVPLILMLSPVGSPAPALVTPWPAEASPTSTCRGRSFLPRLTTSVSDPKPGPPGPVNAEAIAKGWGYAWINTASVQADSAEGLTCGIIGLTNRGQPRGVEDWGAVAAWAWGASRLLDFLETCAPVDMRRVGVYGHSRLGAAALWAAASDPRFALVYASSSGQGGAKLHRRNYGETVDNLAGEGYHQMGANYLKYAGRWDALPVDSHALIALIAPRPVFLSAGADDAWTDPKGMWMSAVAARPVYELFGKKGLGQTEFPPADAEVIGGDIGYRQHRGGAAWDTFYTFATRQFKK